MRHSYKLGQPAEFGPAMETRKFSCFTRGEPCGGVFLSPDHT